MAWLEITIDTAAHQVEAVAQALTQRGFSDLLIEDQEEFEAFLDCILFENDIILQRVRAIATIDIKKDEPCIKEFARKCNIELVTFSADELNLADGDFSGSGYV